MGCGGTDAMVVTTPVGHVASGPPLPVRRWWSSGQHPVSEQNLFRVHRDRDSRMTDGSLDPTREGANDPTTLTRREAMRRGGAGVAVLGLVPGERLLPDPTPRLDHVWMRVEDDATVAFVATFESSVEPPVRDDGRPCRARPAPVALRPDALRAGGARPTDGTERARRPLVVRRGLLGWPLRSHRRPLLCRRRPGLCPAVGPRGLTRDALAVDRCFAAVSSNGAHSLAPLAPVRGPPSCGHTPHVEPTHE